MKFCKEFNDDWMLSIIKSLTRTCLFLKLELIWSEVWFSFPAECLKKISKYLQIEDKFRVNTFANPGLISLLLLTISPVLCFVWWMKNSEWEKNFFSSFLCPVKILNNLSTRSEEKREILSWRNAKITPAYEKKKPIELDKLWNVRAMVSRSTHKTERLLGRVTCLRGEKLLHFSLYHLALEHVQKFHRSFSLFLILF